VKIFFSALLYTLQRLNSITVNKMGSEILSDLNSLNSDVLDSALDGQSTASAIDGQSTASASTSSMLPLALQINGVDYEVAERMRNKRGKTSWVWNEGYQLIKPPPDPNPKKQKPEINWLCRRCYEDGKHVKYKADSTNHVARHLLKVHKLAEHGSTAEDSRLTSRFDFEQFKKLLIQWVIVMHISFSQVENPAFQELLFYLCAALTSLFPTSGNTVRQWIINDFKQRRGQIRKELHLSKSLIHLSFDLWTSPNSLAMLAVVGHFVSHTGEAKSCLLGLRHVEGIHLGENIAQSVIAVIEEYGIKDFLGYFVLDNASSNDTCVQEILKQLRPELDSKKRRL
jgi:hypothetical protein